MNSYQGLILHAYNKDHCLSLSTIQNFPPVNLTSLPGVTPEGKHGLERVSEAVGGLYLYIVQSVNIVHIHLKLVLVRTADFPFIPEGAAMLPPSDKISETRSIVLHPWHWL